MYRLAAASLAHQHGMPHIAHMEIEPEWRIACSLGVQEGWPIQLFAILIPRPNV